MTHELKIALIAALLTLPVAGNCYDDIVDIKYRKELSGLRKRLPIQLESGHQVTDISYKNKEIHYTHLVTKEAFRKPLERFLQEDLLKRIDKDTLAQLIFVVWNTTGHKYWCSNTQRHTFISDGIKVFWDYKLQTKNGPRDLFVLEAHTYDCSIDMERELINSFTQNR